VPWWAGAEACPYDKGIKGSIVSLSNVLKKTIGDVSSVGQLLFAKGWAEKNAGNLSYDVTDLVRVKPTQLKAASFRRQANLPKDLPGRCYLVTGTGTRYRDIQKDPETCLCVLRLSERGGGYHILWGGKGVGFKPTSELSSHLRMQGTIAQRPGGLKVVLHTHPNELIALTHLKDTNDQERLNWALWGMIPEAKLFVPKGIGLVPYRLTGSDDLAEATVKVLSKGFKVVMWEKHGALAVGKDPDEAFDLLDAMNKAATLYLHCLHAGRKPQGLTKAQIEQIARTYPPKD